jgi:hypothetical protein
MVLTEQALRLHPLVATISLAQVKSQQAFGPSKFSCYTER